MMKEKWDKAGINYRTDRTKLRIEVQKEWLQNIQNDPKRPERIARRECVVCFYTTRICGQGFSPYRCRMCGQDEMWANTCVPVLCPRCARENSLCLHCGGDIDLKLRES